MAYAGQILENLVTGERLVFLETANDAGGEYVLFETFVEPDGFVAAHVHPFQEERFRVVEGSGTPGVPEDDEEDAG